MNVTVESLPNCITTLHVQVPKEKVAAARESVTRDYARSARIPGFRPGKAPRSVIETKFKKQITEELQKLLLQESTQEAIKEKKIRVISVSDVEDVQLSESEMQFTATLVTAPEFELPVYKGLAVQVPSAEVMDTDVTKALETLQDQYSSFDDAPARPLAMEDFVVADYTGLADGKAVHEVYPAAGKQLSSGEDFWIRLTPESFLPGFCAQLVGASVGDAREFSIEVPADFPVESMRGKKLDYKVTIKGLKEKKMPELDDDLAGKIAEGKTLDEVKELVKLELQRQKTQNAERAKRDQVMQKLLGGVECELPQLLVKHETQRMLNELVRENQNRGVADEVLKENEQNLVLAASQGAKERLKSQFVLMRIAEKEGITVSREDFQRHLSMMAMRYEIAPDKVLKELQKNNAIEQTHEEIIAAKTLDFLISNASVETLPAEAISNA